MIRGRLVCVLLVSLVSLASLASCSTDGSAAADGNAATVGIVGDSITFLSEPSIEGDLKGWHYDIQAQKGKTIADMTPVMESKIIKGPDGPPHSIVINLGTNDVIQSNRHWRSDWQTLMSDTAAVPCEVLFTVNDIADAYIRRPGGPTAQDINRLVSRAQQADPTRVHVIDWNGEVKATGSVISLEGIHPVAYGQQWIGAHIARTLDQDCRS
jgi:lysophospholipase L1-like esterase